LYVGVLEPHKGVPALLEAAGRPGRFRVKVVGQGSLLAQALDARARSGARVDVEGWVKQDRLSDLYRRARAIVVPSIWHENAPLVAIEALAWGTPLLVSRRGGLEELLYGGATGRAFEPTPEDLIAAGERFLDDDLSHGLRRGARLAYVQNHRPEAYIARYTSLLEQRLDASTRGTEALASDGRPAPLVAQHGSPGGIG